MGALVERKVAAAEQVHRHVERLLRVVVALERVARVDVVVGLDQVDQRLLEVVARRRRHRLLAEAAGAEHVEDEQRVVGGDRPAALRDDGRMGDLLFVAHLLDVVHDVVRVLLQGVVHARLEVGLRAVVVDAQPAADVEVLDAGAGLGQVAVDPRRFVQGVLDDADVGDLAAEVEVEELEAVLHAARAQQLEPAQDLGDGQPELRAVAARGLPAAHAAGRQLDAHADLRPHADLLGVLQDQLELGVLLDHRDDVAADLLGQHRHLDELGVLEPVADDRRVVGGHGGHGQQLGLGPGLEAEPVLAPEVHHFLHDLALLVDLDRVDADVAALVLVLGDGVLERRVDLAEAMLEDVGEAHEDRRAQPAQLQPVDQLLEVDRAARRRGSGAPACARRR